MNRMGPRRASDDNRTYYLIERTPPPQSPIQKSNQIKEESFNNGILDIR
jgi:hypothetical protein